MKDNLIPITELEAIRLINDNCKSDDYDVNGCNLDTIITNFLRTNGYKNLANAMVAVDCWRA
jgi:hypothetical protein